jgi:type IV pilus assembly protein PilM
MAFRFSFGDRNILCLDWDQRSLRIVDANLSRSTVRVRHAVHVPIAVGVNVRDASSLGQFIRQTLAEHRIRTKLAVVDVPREEVVLNRLSLPFGTTDEMAAMVHIQIAKELPFNKDQAVIDFAVTREEGTDACDVWVAAVRSNIVDHYQQVIESARLKMERIGLRPYANLCSTVVDGRVDGWIVLVDVGPSMTEINIIRDGKLAYSRAASVSIPVEGLHREPPAKPSSLLEPGDEVIPLAELAPEPSPMDQLLVEVNRTIEAYRITDPGARIDQIILAGTCGVDQRLAAAFEKRFETRTRLYEAPKALRWRSRGQSPVAFGAAFGLALSNITEEMQHFDFLHPKEPEAEKRERVKQRPKLVAAVACFVIAAGALAYQPIRSRNHELDRLQAEIDDLNADEEEREAFMDQLDDVKAWQARRIGVLDHIEYLVRALPSNEEAYLTQLRLEVREDEGSLSIEMDAKDVHVATTVTEEVVKIKAEDTDKEIFIDPEVRRATEGPNPKYPVRDELTVPIRSLKVVEKKKKKR